MKKVLLLLAPGFEELEAIAPLDILRRGGVSVDTAATGSDKIVAGGHQIRVQADKTLEECEAGTYDMVIIPGGGVGVDNLQSDGRVLQLIKDFKEQDKWIAAICAGPKVLTKAGVADESRLTSYPSVKDELLSRIKEYSEDRIVMDGKIITSRGPGCAEAFGFALLETLTDAETARKVKEEILSSVP